jgi:hypothetical protein
MEKRELLKEHTKQFTQFIKSIDFEVINSDINSRISEIINVNVNSTETITKGQNDQQRKGNVKQTSVLM